MHCRSTLSTPAKRARALAFAAVLPAFAHATPKALADDEMSAVRGADGSIVADITPVSAKARNGFDSGLGAAFASSTGSAVLTAAQFTAALAAVGLTPDAIPGYNGQPVVQTVVDAKPVTFSFTFGDVLQSTTGLQYNPGNGPSLGTFTMSNFDARGTTLWVFQHH